MSGDDLTMDLKDETSYAPVGDQIYQQKHALQLLQRLGTADTYPHYDMVTLIQFRRLQYRQNSLAANEVHQQLRLQLSTGLRSASGLECLQSIYNNQLQDEQSASGQDNQFQDFNNKL
jgi:hypothetical protein